MANHNPKTNQPRNGGHTWCKDPAVADRDAEATRLRKQGMTYQQIAEAMGYADKASAWRAVARCMADTRNTAAAELIAVEAAELDRLYTEALAVLERDHVLVQFGKVIEIDGVPEHDTGPKLAAIDRLVRIRESYRRLLGLDQPAKQEISGGVKYEVVGISTEDLA